MVDGWDRVCPDCRNADGAKVERIAFHPTVRCECGYVWNGSHATFVGLFKPPTEPTDEKWNALAGVIFGRTKEVTGRPVADRD
jgi:hypothetical protein